MKTITKITTKTVIGLATLGAIGLAWNAVSSENKDPDKVTKKTQITEQTEDTFLIESDMTSETVSINVVKMEFEDHKYILFNGYRRLAAVHDPKCAHPDHFRRLPAFQTSSPSDSSKVYTPEPLPIPMSPTSPAVYGGQ